MRLWHLTHVVALALLMAGCGTLPPPAPPPPPPESTQTTDLLAYYHRLTLMTPEDQRREYNAAQADYEKVASDDNRIRLALALLIPDAPWRDDGQVLKLLAADPSLQQGKQTPRGDLALLVDRLVSERLRLLREENRKLEAMQQKMTALREEHRKIEMLKQKLEAMNEECSKSEALQKKLEGLREIDRDLRKRPTRRSAP